MLDNRDRHASIYLGLISKAERLSEVPDDDDVAVSRVAHKLVHRLARDAVRVEDETVHKIIFNIKDEHVSIRIAQ